MTKSAALSYLLCVAVEVADAYDPNRILSGDVRVKTTPEMQAFIMYLVDLIYGKGLKIVAFRDIEAGDTFFPTSTRWTDHKEYLKYVNTGPETRGYILEQIPIESFRMVIHNARDAKYYGPRIILSTAASFAVTEKGKVSGDDPTYLNVILNSASCTLTKFLAYKEQIEKFLQFHGNITVECIRPLKYGDYYLRWNNPSTCCGGEATFEIVMCGSDVGEMMPDKTTLHIILSGPGREIVGFVVDASDSARRPIKRGEYYRDPTEPFRVLYGPTTQPYVPLKPVYK